LRVHDNMSQLERLIKIAEDELTEYSSKARKIEKLRRKIGLSVIKAVQTTLLAEMEPGGFRQLVAEQRQAVALPFWGVAGFGLLAAISFNRHSARKRGQK